MLDPFERAVGEFIRCRGLVPPGGQVVAAASGGPDSTALLLALERLRADGGFDLTAFHYNHRLRPAAQLDEGFVRDLCSRLGVSLQVGQAEQAGQTGPNLEDRARRLRYRALIEAARRLEADVATGHTLDDQAETVLLKLMRGAGPEGLSAIAPSRTVRAADGQVAIIRPLLGRRRQEVLEYLKRRGEGFRQDESNADLSLDRNWVRAELIPLLEGRLNPGLVATLGRNAQLWAEAHQWLMRQAEEVLQACLQPEGDVVIPLQALQQHPAIVQRSALRQAVLKMRGGSGFDPFSLTPEPARKAIRFVHIEALLGLARKAPGRQIQLPGGLWAVREKDQIRLTKREPARAETA